MDKCGQEKFLYSPAGAWKVMSPLFLVFEDCDGSFHHTGITWNCGYLNKNIALGFFYILFLLTINMKIQGKQFISAC